MRSFHAGVTFTALLISVGVAGACGPFPEQYDRWSLDRREYSGSGGSGMPFLSPGNDSRINLQFLMRDAHPETLPSPSTVSGGKARDNFYDNALFPLYERNAAFAPDAGAAAVDPVEKGDLAFPRLAEGEGSICRSSEGGKRDFVAAVQAEPGLTDAEKSLLAEARSQWSPTCAKSASDTAPLQSPLAATASAIAQDFATYLTGADRFYQSDFDAALASFRKLDKTDNAWLREAARYMVARTLLNKGEVGAFSGDFDVSLPRAIDRDSLNAAEVELRAYLAAYPTGRYSASASGLFRRIYWLEGDQPRLAAEYGAQIAHWSAERGESDDLANEIDDKYLRDAKTPSHDPNLLAAQDLILMRTVDGKKPTFPAADLEAQAADFSGHEALFGFLKAARAFYVDDDFTKTLALLGPAQPGPLSPPYLGFSSAVLRGAALMAQGHFQRAVEHWRGLMPLAAQTWQREAVELGLAMSWERTGEESKVFAQGTPIESPRIRAILLRQSAGPILLRMAVADPRSLDERKIARSILLFKEATRGQYAGFLSDYSRGGLISDDAGATDGRTPPDFGVKSAVFLWPGASAPYRCPALTAVIGELAANPRVPRGLLCLGEFVRASGLDEFESVRPKLDELGGGKPIFPGEPFSRGEIYKRLIADPSTPDNDRAYALYRAVNCYAPTGANGCGGTDVELEQRKAWFKRLKSQYGGTAWAKSLQFYW